MHSANQRRFEIEARFLAASGEYRWLLCRGQPVADAGGRFAGYLGTSTDISPRKASERSATLAAARFRALTDTVPNIVWSAGPGGAIEFVNARWREYSGMSADEARSAYWIDFVHPDDKAEAMATWLASVRSGAPYACEYRLRRHDGMYRWHMVQACPVHDGEGRIVEWSGVCTDVHGMRALNTRMRMLADALPQMVSVSATDGSVLYFNQRWHDYTGLDFEDSDGWGWVQALHPDDREAARDYWRPALEDGVTLEVELRFRRVDGAYRWHILRAVPIREADGTLIAWFATATDVDELRYQQTRWQAIADSVSELVWTAGTDGKVTFANARVGEYTGTPVEQLIATDWADFVHAQDTAVAVKTYFGAVRSGQPFEFECRLRRFDGEYRWHLARGTALRDAGGSILGWVGSAIDVHDLHAEKLGSRVISDAIPALVFTARTDGRLEYANRRAGDYLGRSTVDLFQHGWGNPSTLQTGGGRDGSTERRDARAVTTRANCGSATRAESIVGTLCERCRCATRWADRRHGSASQRTSRDRRRRKRASVS